MAVALHALVATQDVAAIRPANPANIEENFRTLMKFYPERALAAREEGIVGFTVKLDRDAKPTACEVTYSSGHRRLDEETCGIVLTHAFFKPTYDQSGARMATVREGVINWKLPTTARSLVPAIPAAVTAATAPDKMICKRRQRSNNLAAFERICMTAREWAEERERMKETIQEDQGSKGFSTGITIGFQGQ